MTNRSVSTHGKPSSGPSSDLGELMTITGGFAFAVASCLALRDALTADTGVSTLLPFAGAGALVLIGIAMREIRKRAGA
jgi:hypothetical protein